jgi:hypothetical protein
MCIPLLIAGVVQRACHDSRLRPISIQFDPGSYSIYKRTGEFPDGTH